MNQSLVFLAFVREWNSSMVRVQCPFCLQTHSHGPGSLNFKRDSFQDSLSKRRRVPHCGHLSDHYQMCFPFDDAARDRGYSWFVDKEEQRYMTIGLTPEVDDENYFVKEPKNNKDHDDVSITTELSDSANSDRDSADELANELQLKVKLEHNSFADFYRKEMIDLKRRKVWFVSHCLLKETALVRHMLHQYEKDKLYSDRDEYGSDVMSLVAMEGHVCIMELLHEAGAGVSNTDVRGRKPLMEAALWGREDAVKFLLEKGADPGLKDHKSRTALNLTEDTDSNRREREARSCMYRDSQDSRHARIRICAQLAALTGTISLTQEAVLGHTTFSTGHFQQFGLDLAWYNRAISYELDFATRTVGILSYSRYLPVVFAMSGANHYLPRPQTLDNRIWTFRVRDLCEAIGFQLHSNHRDPLFDGSFNACHAEKQLATYYIDRHFFWGTELENRDLQNLQTVQPIGSPLRATIVVNRPVCQDCETFLRQVQDHFAVEIDVQSR